MVDSEFLSECDLRDLRHVNLKVHRVAGKVDWCRNLDRDRFPNRDWCPGIDRNRPEPQSNAPVDQFG
jgi:hypothetical protein